jgi:hypothetical protein
VWKVKSSQNVPNLKLDNSETVEMARTP